jgi:prefoldin subunit 5
LGNDALKVYKEKFEEIEGEINALRDSLKEAKA